MAIMKPYRRNCRQFQDGTYSNLGVKHRKTIRVMAGCFVKNTVYNSYTLAGAVLN